MLLDFQFLDFLHDLGPYSTLRNFVVYLEGTLFLSAPSLPLLNARISPLWGFTLHFPSRLT